MLPAPESGEAGAGHFRQDRTEHDVERVVWFDTIGMDDVARVGGKNASLGEMIGSLAASGVKVPGGFATTADAFREFLDHNALEERIAGALEGLDVEDVAALAATGERIRRWVTESELPGDLEQAVRAAHGELTGERAHAAVAVRSSATAEDLPEASFAGQQETYLNVVGVEAVLGAIKSVFASLYNDRAIAYRVHQDFAHADVALSAGVQRMVRSDSAASGVTFTMDTESGFDQVVFITSSYGLGETVVQGQVNPDEFYVYKPALRAGRPAIVRRERGSKALRMVLADDGVGRVRVEPVPEREQHAFSLSDADIETLARYALLIEDHYARPMDIAFSRHGPKPCRAAPRRNASSASSSPSAARC
jgi:pyruvate,water dikinase